MKQSTALGNALDNLRGEMKYLSGLRHDPNDTEGKLYRETDAEWWGRKGGVMLVQLENLRRAAEGLASELAGRVDNPAGLEHRIRTLLSRLRDEWLPMFRPGDWSADESARLNAIYDELGAVATIMRELPTANARAGGKRKRRRRQKVSQGEPRRPKPIDRITWRRYNTLGSMQKVADELGCVKSTVSARVKRVEKWIDASGTSRQSLDADYSLDSRGTDSGSTATAELR